LLKYDWSASSRWIRPSLFTVSRLSPSNALFAAPCACARRYHRQQVAAGRKTPKGTVGSADTMKQHAFLDQRIQML
jgi:hypothetical protein